MSSNGNARCATNNEYIFRNFSKLKSNDINEDVIAQSKITYLEGYLWDLDDAQEAIKKAIKISKEANRLVAFSVSDVFALNDLEKVFKSS